MRVAPITYIQLQLGGGGGGELMLFECMGDCVLSPGRNVSERFPGVVVSLK